MTRSPELFALLLLASATACGTARDSAAPLRPEAGGGNAGAPDAALSPSAEPSAVPAERSAVPAAPSASADAAPAPSPSPSAEPAAAPSAPSGPPARGHELDRFHAALRALEHKELHRHVRIAWLGDSHAAADFWSGGLRDILQKRFGAAGPGFIHVGYRDYRHDDVKVGVEGKWKIRPKTPAAQKTIGDGVFGLGGMMMSGYEDGPRVTVSVEGPPLPPKLDVDLCYRLTYPSDALAVTVAGAPRVEVKATATEPPGAIRHARFASDVPAKIEILPTSGRPELCGVIVESDPRTAPGVIVDTLGINGARYGTALAWNEEAWIAELYRRAPDLVILEYGTNEASDHESKPLRYASHMKELVERVRKAKPDADIVVIGPSDRADAEDRIPPIRDAIKAAAAEAHCLFWDTHAVMGGKGAIRAWRDEVPPRAAKDGIHLVIKGYRELAQRLAADLLKGY